MYQGNSNRIFGLRLKNKMGRMKTLFLSRVRERRSLALAVTLVSLVVVARPTEPSPVRTQGPAPVDVARWKSIALTFDDGPKPYVLVGRKSQNGVSSPSLLELLDREGVKTTFFVMGFRLADSANEFCRGIDVGINCRQAAEEVHRRGHEIENHTHGHGAFSRMAKRYGEEWILSDIDRASRIIQSVTGVRPQYVRPPDGDIWEGLLKKIESRGYHVMTKSQRNIAEAPALEDVDSQDYLYSLQDSSKSPVTTERNYVLNRIQQRERKGVYTHVLVFHELPISVEVLSTLIPELKKRGYVFQTLREYMKMPGAAAK